MKGNEIYKVIKEVQTNIGKVIIHNTYRPRVSDYTVFKGVVYRVVASEGNILDWCLTLESNGRQERFSVKQPEVGCLRKILKPTGYIDC